MNTFGKYIRALRKNCGLTLMEVEKKGVASNAYVCQLESGVRRHPRPDVLKRMSKIYNEPLRHMMVEAGYLPPRTGKAPTPRKTEIAFESIQKVAGFPHGARRPGVTLSLAAKRYFVELYEATTGRRIF
jgi:transcriptional regulator with XRE-family HTH domain